MNENTSEQLKAIQTWSGQRESLLFEIGSLSTERDRLSEAVTEKSHSLTDVALDISNAHGRLTILKTLEEHSRSSVSLDVAQLEARKSRLEAECVAKEEYLKILDFRCSEKVAEIGVLSLAQDKMSDQSEVVDQIVGQVIEKSLSAVSEMKVFMADIETIVGHVIQKSNENVNQTNIVLEKLPRYIFELQKPIPIRRVFEAPPNTIIEPEDALKET